MDSLAPTCESRDKMEIEYSYNLASMDKQEFNDEEKNQNYCQIVRTIQFLENGGRITEDWMVENIDYIKMYRGWIADFSKVNEEREDREFRKCCEETETLMQYLSRTVHTSDYFDPKVYLLFLRHMKKLCDMLFAEDELEACMRMLSM